MHQADILIQNALLCHRTRVGEKKMVHLKKKELMLDISNRSYIVLPNHHKKAIIKKRLLNTEKLKFTEFSQWKIFYCMWPGLLILVLYVSFLVKLSKRVGYMYPISCFNILHTLIYFIFILRVNGLQQWA